MEVAKTVLLGDGVEVAVALAETVGVLVEDSVRLMVGVAVPVAVELGLGVGLRLGLGDRETEGEEVRVGITRTRASAESKLPREPVFVMYPGPNRKRRSELPNGE